MKWNREEGQAGLRETVSGWIEWARQKLPEDGNVPPIFNAGWGGDAWWKTVGEAPWNSRLEDFFDIDFEQGAHVLSSTLKELDLADLPTRFVALSVCYALAHYEPVLLNEDLASQARRRHEKNLADLIRLVPIEFFDDWRRIRWEILNAYVISDWRRALRLYNRAEELDPLRPGEIQVLRGQFRFLAALSEETVGSLDSLLWPPEVYSVGSIESDFLFVAGLVPMKGKVRTLAAVAKEMLRQAVPDLETAMTKRDNLSPAYRAVLARCYFLTEHFHDAGREYEKLLSEHLGVLGNVLGVRFKAVVYRSAARSFQRDGQTEKAREISESWLMEYPDDPEALRLMADVQARQLNFEKAVEYYRRLVDLKPELEEDVATKIALALGGVSPAKLSTLAEDLMKKRPEATELIKSLNLELWPAYKASQVQHARSGYMAAALCTTCHR
jgi:tetratricopeptide (TPR) repeat protein